MKRICIFITHKFPFQTDETFIENEIEYLAKAFDTVLLFALYAHPRDKQTREVPENVYVVSLGYSSMPPFLKILTGLQGFAFGGRDAWHEVSRLPQLGWKQNCFYVTGLAKRMKNDALRIVKQKIDLSEFSSCLVYSYWFSEHALLAASLKEYCKAEVPVRAVSRAHRYDVYAYRKKYKAFPFKESMLRGMDVVYPCSDDGTAYLATEYPSYAHKLETAYLGTIDYGENPGSVKDFFCIVSCSNIVPVKRVHLLAQALAEVKGRGFIDFTWICIGDGPLMSSLKQQVTDYGLEANVTYTGRIPNRDVIDLYKKQHIDVFVNVSENEGLPVSIMEAQSFGIPCIATDVGGSSEILVEGVGVLLPAPFLVSELADHIIMYMEKRTTDLLSIRKNARSNWLRTFNAKTNYEKWIGTITEGLV
jgi:glycosyltransferase involved in cell wall biosynthesis